jgi:hypothetical protein
MKEVQRMSHRKEVQKKKKGEEKKEQNEKEV